MLIVWYGIFITPGMKIFYPVLLVTFLLFFLQSCKKLLQYHPNEVRLEERDRNLNAKSIARLFAQPKKQSFRFAVTGDSQRFYDDLAALVEKVNTYDDISFLVLNGDITDFGLNREYKWVSRELQKLQVPFIGVIGNHDMLANGRLIYQQMFGPENFSFEYNGYKFIALNSNSREVGYNGSIPDTSWLREEVAEQNSQFQPGIFVFSHVPPTNEDFDPRLSAAYSSILTNSARVLFSIHGHQHGYSLAQPYGPPVQYLGAGSLHKRSFAIINVTPDSTHAEQVFF